MKKILLTAFLFQITLVSFSLAQVPVTRISTIVGSADGKFDDLYGNTANISETLTTPKANINTIEMSTSAFSSANCSAAGQMFFTDAGLVVCEDDGGSFTLNSAASIFTALEGTNQIVLMDKFSSGYDISLTMDEAEQNIVEFSGAAAIRVGGLTNPTGTPVADLNTTGTGFIYDAQADRLLIGQFSSESKADYADGSQHVVIIGEDNAVQGDNSAAITGKNSWVQGANNSLILNGDTNVIASNDITVISGSNSTLLADSGGATYILGGKDTSINAKAAGSSVVIAAGDGGQVLIGPAPTTTTDFSTINDSSITIALTDYPVFAPHIGAGTRRASYPVVGQKTPHVIGFFNVTLQATGCTVNSNNLPTGAFTSSVRSALGTCVITLSANLCEAGGDTYATAAVRGNVFGFAKTSNKSETGFTISTADTTGASADLNTTAIFACEAKVSDRSGLPAITDRSIAPAAVAAKPMMVYDF